MKAYTAAMPAWHPTTRLKTPARWWAAQALRAMDLRTSLDVPTFRQPLCILSVQEVAHPEHQANRKAP